jgi:hypothetical protein
MNKAIVAILGKPQRPSRARTAAQRVVQDSCHYKRNARARSSSPFCGDVAHIVGQFVLFPLLLAETTCAVIGHFCPPVQGREKPDGAEKISH